MAETYATRPSRLLGISDPYAAYCVDEALYVRLTLERQRQSDEEPLDDLAPPSGRELAAIPWGGDGADPLEAAG